ncbi:hypothetical protein [Paenibacillus gansuensis]|uniref:Uncharacterized protein n=1 Tax=Paenibacillus gansuensis TaxID=306542 RepID=A0ABW5PGW5_9BACL
MRWKVLKVNGRFLVCRKTWHSPEWMGIDKKDIRQIETNNGRKITVEVFAECGTRELADRLLRLCS